MNAPSAADVVRWWPLTTASAHTRVVAFLSAADGPDTLRQPLGRHHQRVLSLHRAFVGTALEAVVTCRHCGVDSEFPIPVSDVLGLPAPGPDHLVSVEVAGHATDFRLPTVGDVAATSGASYDEAVRAIARATCRTKPAPEIDPDQLRDLAAAWEEADPAATISVELACVSCSKSLFAVVDPAEFVARDLDRHVERLLADVHTLASSYGWGEHEILALPDERRRRYLRLVDAGRTRAGRSLSLATS